MLKLKLQYFGPWCQELAHWKRPWCWERFKAGGERDNRGWDGWMASKTQWTWVWANSGRWWWAGVMDRWWWTSLGCCSPWVTKSQTWLSDWTKTTNIYFQVLTNVPEWSKIWKEEAKYRVHGNSVLSLKLLYESKTSLRFNIYFKINKNQIHNVSKELTQWFSINSNRSTSIRANNKNWHYPLFTISFLDCVMCFNLAYVSNTLKTKW